MFHRSPRNAMRRALLTGAVLAAGATAVQATPARAVPTPGPCPAFNVPNRQTSGTTGGGDNRFVVSRMVVDDDAIGDSNTKTDILWTDRATGDHAIVSKPLDGQANGHSSAPIVTPDGRYVVFKSEATNLVGTDTNGAEDIFLVDRQEQTIERVNVTTDGTQAGAAGPEVSWGPDRLDITPDGRFVAFTSASTVLNPLGDGTVRNVFVRDRLNGTTTLASVTNDGKPSGRGGSAQPSISDDGRYVAFASAAAGFGPYEPSNVRSGVVIRDMATATNDHVAHGGDYASAQLPTLSADGRTVAFTGTGPSIGLGQEAYGPFAFLSDRAAGSYENLSAGLPDRTSIVFDQGVSITPDASHAAFVWSGTTPGGGISASYVIVRDVATGGLTVAGGRYLAQSPWSAPSPQWGAGAAGPLQLSADGTMVSYNAGSDAIVTPTDGVLLTAIQLPNINRSFLKQGDSHLKVQAHGFNLANAAFDLGDGITVHSVKALAGNLGSVELDISVAPDAAVGPRAPTATRTGCLSMGTAFRVESGAAITSVGPRFARANAAQTFNLVGSGFVSGATVSVSGEGFTTSKTTVTDATHASFTVTTAANLTGGARSVTITNPNGSTGTCIDCLTIDTIPPAVAFIGPSDKQLPDIFIGVLDEGTPGEWGSIVSVTRNGAAVPFTRSNPEYGLVQLHLTNPMDGNYTVKVTPVDKAGNKGPLVTRVVQQGETITTLNAYGAFTGGAETTAGDVDGDGIAEIISAAGAGGGPHVRVFKVDAVTKSTKELAGFFAYDASQTQGVRVATADVDGDGTAEIVTSLGRGGVPEVRVFHITKAGVVQKVAQYLAYASNVRVGISVSGGDTNGDGKDEVITSPGPGAGPHVRAWSVKNGSATESSGFMAYNPAFTGGVRATAADLNADGIAELVTGAGPGGGPHVQAFDISHGAAQSVASFYAYDPNFTGGVTPSGGDIDGDGWDELIVSAGGGGGPHVRVLAVYEDGVEEYAGFYAYAANFTGGVSAAAGDFDGDGDEDIVTTPGPGMPVQIVARRAI